MGLCANWMCKLSSKQFYAGSSPVSPILVDKAAKLLLLIQRLQEFLAF